MCGRFIMIDINEKTKTQITINQRYLFNFFLTSLHWAVKVRSYYSNSRLAVQSVTLWWTVQTRYSLLSIPGVVLVTYSQFQLTSDCDHAFGLNLAPSLHLLPLPIRSDTGRWLSALTSRRSSLTWHRRPRTASLTLPVKTSSNCCHSGPALSHHSIPNEEKAGRESQTEMYMCDMCKSSVTVLWRQLSTSARWPFSVYGGGRVIYGPMQNSLTFPGSVSFSL